MPRTLAPELTAALDSGSFQPYFLLTVREVGFSILETAQPVYFKLNGIFLTVKWYRPSEIVYEGFLLEDLEFMVTRGVTIAGANYTIDSSYYFGTSNTWDGTYQTVEACMLPDLKYTAAGDDTYENVLTALCNAYGKTAVFDDPAAAWLNYQFLGAGKTLTLNRANSILTMIKQKRLIYATDNGNNEILFHSAADDLHAVTDHTLRLGLFKNQSAIATQRRFMSRDENGTIRYTGNTDAPLWNLGYLESTDAHPGITNSFPFELNPIAPHLKYLSFDKLTFTYENYPNATYISSVIPSAKVVEEFDTKAKEPVWRVILSNIDWSGATEGGALPGTIEAAAPYTPLNTSNFNGTLSSNDNNIQAAMDTLDDHTHPLLPSAPVQAPTATNDFLIGAQVASVWTWVKNTLAQTITVLRTSLDSIYAPIAKGVTNGDSHNHVGGDGAALKYSDIYGGHGANQTLAAGATGALAFWYNGFIPTGANTPMPKGGTLKNFNVRISGTQPGTGSLVFTVYVNNAATSIVATCAAGGSAITISDTTHSVTIAASDLVYVSVKNNASGTSATVAGFNIELEQETA